ncbi:hypothetical protein RJ55_07265 [Drechmeria coniospora]|nr:hypothetical protein RJ55_07265 [Drechmeria coniospora]
MYEQRLRLPTTLRRTIHLPPPSRLPTHPFVVDDPGPGSVKLYRDVNLKPCVNSTVIRIWLANSKRSYAQAHLALFAALAVWSAEHPSLSLALRLCRIRPVSLFSGTPPQLLACVEHGSDMTAMADEQCTHIACSLIRGAGSPQSTSSPCYGCPFPHLIP